METRNSKLISAVGYARRSTDMQERSIPDQQAYVEKWAKEHGYEKSVCKLTNVPGPAIDAFI